MRTTNQDTDDTLVLQKNSVSLSATLPIRRNPTSLNISFHGLPQINHHAAAKSCKHASNNPHTMALQQSCQTLNINNSSGLFTFIPAQSDIKSKTTRRAQRIRTLDTRQHYNRSVRYDAFHTDGSVLMQDLTALA